jgi:predicted enzyme related to lactoylglutathione lyase
MKAKLVSINVPTNNHEKSSAFYSKLLGTDFVESLGARARSSHAPLSNEGHWMWISDRMDDEEKITAVFAVDNIQASINELTDAGGELIMLIPTPIAPEIRDRYQRDIADRSASDRVGPPPGTTGGGTSGGTSGGTHEGPPKGLGPYALVRDPDGNVIGLFSPEDHAQRFFKVGRYETPLNEETLAGVRRAQAAATELRQVRQRNARSK